ncbi:MAG: hypothetical protein J6W35_07500 [Eubacterium sp.]|nr:hypothetical protein [Eubacterium sp.]
MQSITKESENTIDIIGVLKERNVEEAKSKEGKQYVKGTAIISTITEVEGKAVESEHKIDKMVFRLKKDGTPNKLYDAVLDWNKLVSLASATEQTPASRVVLQSSAIEENMWVPSGKDEVASNPKIKVGWLKTSNEDKDKAEFTLTGVVVKEPYDEEKDQTPTGRLRLKIGVFGYCDASQNPDGNIHIIDLIVASEAGVNWFRSNVKEYDTIRVQGDIINSHKTVITEVSEGFGVIQKPNTVSVKEFRVRAAVVLQDDDLIYDVSDVKRALKARLVRKEDVLARSKERAANASASASAKGGLNDFGLDDVIPF